MVAPATCHRVVGTMGDQATALASRTVLRTCFLMLLDCIDFIGFYIFSIYGCHHFLALSDVFPLPRSSHWPVCNCGPPTPSTQLHSLLLLRLDKATEGISCLMGQLNSQVTTDHRPGLLPLKKKVLHPQDSPSIRIPFLDLLTF